MAIDFPNSPALNDYFESSGKTWIFNGTSWDIVQFPVNLIIADASITGAKLASGAAVTNIGYTPANTVSPTFTGVVTLPDNTVALGAKTTGDYVASLVAGTGVTLTNGTASEGGTPTIAIGQAVGTSASVTFASVTAPLTGNASTATTLQTSRNIAGQSFNGSANISIAPTDLTGVTSTAAELNILSGATLSTTELNYVDGVTSAIQTQMDTKSPSASPTFTGTVTGNPAVGTTSTGTSGFGYMGLPQNGATTGAYGIVAADAGTHIYSSATRTITIPANGTIAMPIGSTIVFIAGSGATVTIAITTDTMLLAGAGTTGSRTLAPFGMATAVKITATSWIISGNGLT
jgi:hypothetical protein